MKIAVCAIAKNENLYIREWVEWYKNLGVSKIFLYDNNDPDGERFEEVIDDYIKSGFVEVIDVRGNPVSYEIHQPGLSCRCSLQHKCYVDCYNNRLSEFDWVCFFDIDEFLKFRDGYTLESFLNQDMYTETDTILVPWVTYDDNGLIHYDNRPVVERFTHISKNQWYTVKSFARTNKVMYSELLSNIIHCFKLMEGRIKFADGSDLNEKNIFFNFPITEESVVNNCKCVVNHYKTKTVEEYLKRHTHLFWMNDNIFEEAVTESFEQTVGTFFTYCERTPEKEAFINEYMNENNIES